MAIFKKIGDFITNWLVLVALVLFFIVLGILASYFYKYPISEDLEQWGQFGDYVGGVLNPLLSFSALIVLVRTYSMQREELKNVKETQKKQQFENTFFELLRIHNENLEGLLNLNHSDDYDNFLSELSSELYIRRDKYLQLSGKEYLKKSLTNLTEQKSHVKNPLEHYFRILYQLLKFIAVNASDGAIKQCESNKLEENKKPTDSEKTYSNVVRALLPDTLIKLIAIYACREKVDGSYYIFRLLIERYSFFENHVFEEKDNCVISGCWEFYDALAFGELKMEHE
ncbi:MAG: putative phage abortive infection protein [Methylococcaceae bacterium]